MPLVKRYTFTSGTRLSSTQLNTNFDDIYNTFNNHQHTGQGNDAPQISSSGIAAGGSLVTTTFSNPYKFSVYRNAAWTSPNNSTGIVNFDAKDYDTGTNVDITTNKGRFTAPVTGFYLFQTSVYVNGTVRLRTQLFKNGSGDKIIFDSGSQLAAPLAGGAAMLSLAANDYVEVYIFTSSAVTGITGSASTWFQGELIAVA